ncbi:MAG: hypothetical protein R2864_14035 [Syntrophotaleaceae bacterium]
MATVRHKVMKEAVPMEGRNGELVVEQIADALLCSRTKRLRFEVERETTMNINEANIIVSAGGACNHRKISACFATWPMYWARGGIIQGCCRCRLDPSSHQGGTDR